MAVKQVFETYVYAHLLSSSAMPPFVLGMSDTLIYRARQQIVGAGLPAIASAYCHRRTRPQDRWQASA